MSGKKVAVEVSADEFFEDTVEALAAVENITEKTPVEQPELSVSEKSKELRGTLVYIGPTIMRTELISGRVFICGERTINEVLREELTKYPLAREMFVTPEEAARARAKLNDPKSYLHMACMKLKKSKVEEG